MSAALAGMATVIVALGLLGLFAAALPAARERFDRLRARLSARARARPAARAAPSPVAEAELAAAIAIALHHERRRGR